MVSSATQFSSGSEISPITSRKSSDAKPELHLFFSDEGVTTRSPLSRSRPGGERRGCCRSPPPVSPCSSPATSQSSDQRVPQSTHPHDIPSSWPAGSGDGERCQRPRLPQRQPETLVPAFSPTLTPFGRLRGPRHSPDSHPFDRCPTRSIRRHALLTPAPPTNHPGREPTGATMITATAIGRLVKNPTLD